MTINSLFPSRKANGFSLIELIVVLIILSILAAFAIPAYNNYIEKTDLADAKQKLIALKQSIETEKLGNPHIKTADAFTSSWNKLKPDVKKYRLLHTINDKNLYLQAVPTNPNYKYGLWMDWNNSVYRCRGLSDQVLTAKAGSCESF